MILVDSSVWINHLRKGDADLTTLLNKGAVVCHQFVIGELACGNIKNRQEIISLLEALPQTHPASHEEVMGLLDNWKLMGKGLGYIDAHLIASAALTKVPILTYDRRLNDIAAKLGLSA